MERLEAVIFDFDGTLAELTIDFSLMRRQIGALAEAFLEGEAPEATTPVLEWIDSLSRRLDSLEPGRGLEFSSRCRLLITAVEMDAAQKGRLFPYALELLDQLAARGLKRGIITRNCSAAVRRVFPSILEHCEVFLPREDVPLVKPHPDHLLRAIRSLKTQPVNCLMVGDHAMDIQVARDSGARSAGVASGKMLRPELQAERPDFLFDHAGELLEALDSAGLF